MSNTHNTKAVWKYSLTREKVLEIRENQRLDSPSEVAKVLQAIGLDRLEQEHFVCFHLDTKHSIKAYTVVTIGLVDRSHVHAREVFRLAIMNGSSRVLLAHNHPSGDATPSEQDIDCNRKLVAAGKIIGIDVLDHVIIGTSTASRPKAYLSFREEGLL
ncbi:hypothetical protein HN588_14585 [Candidatus Bathyarchaeota archaeon]|jgi:DNA repair protein RadC|nr:hypothetical protein [Candidatus Bathyarchaeota archaeon]